MNVQNNLFNAAYEQAKKNKKVIESDNNRLHFHLMPAVGLLNDPNGFIQFKGVYHVFFQWNPFETAHGAKFWGHYSSTDLINWNEEPIALAPDEWFDKNGCYSGSAVEHEGKMYLFYTGNVKEENGDRSTYQCLAISEDGIHFEKRGLSSICLKAILRIFAIRKYGKRMAFGIWCLVHKT